MQQIREFFKGEEGATAVEYGIMVALIAAVIIAVVIVLGQQVCEGFDTVSDGMNTVSGLTQNTETC